MKKIVLAFAAMAAVCSASVSAAGYASFQWNGAVPELETSCNGYFIVPAPGSKPFQDGVLSFKNDIANGVTLESADILSFLVFEDVDGNSLYDPAVDVNQATSFNYSLSYFKVGVNQAPQFYYGDYFSITANGSELTSTLVQHTGQDAVGISVAGDHSVDKSQRGLKALDTVQVQAVIALSNVIL